jgi:hypothetical protein
MKLDWQLIGEWAALGIIMGYMAFDALAAYIIEHRSRKEQKTSRYAGPFSFMAVDKANDGKLYFGDKPWKNQNLENRIKN